MGAEEGIHVGLVTGDMVEDIEGVVCCYLLRIEFFQIFFMEAITEILRTIGALRDLLLQSGFVQFLEEFGSLHILICIFLVLVEGVGLGSVGLALANHLTIILYQLINT